METIEDTKPEVAPGVDLREVNREDYELPSSAYGAVVKHDKDGRPIEVKLTKGRRLAFDKPGRRLAGKRLYTIKGEKPDGSVIQIPLEGQINNQVASPDNFIGIRFYQRRGVRLFFDLETGTGDFCPAWDCWAAWNDKFGGFCCPQHKELTKPDPRGSIIGEGATTSGNAWRQL
jgi:hypothetical protein